MKPSGLFKRPKALGAPPPADAGGGSSGTTALVQPNSLCQRPTAFAAQPAAAATAALSAAPACAAPASAAPAWSASSLFVRPKLAAGSAAGSKACSSSFRGDESKAPSQAQPAADQAPAAKRMRAMTAADHEMAIFGSTRATFVGRRTEEPDWDADGVGSRGAHSLYAEDEQLARRKASAREVAALQQQEEEEKEESSASSSAPLWSTLKVGSECLAAIGGRWLRVRVAATTNAGFEIARFRVEPLTTGGDRPRASAPPAVELECDRLRALPANDAARLARGRCAFFDRGECKRGDRCAFFHAEAVHAEAVHAEAAEEAAARPSAASAAGLPSRAAAPQGSCRRPPPPPPPQQHQHQHQHQHQQHSDGTVTVGVDGPPAQPQDGTSKALADAFFASLAPPPPPPPPPR